MIETYREGKVKAIGVSNFGISDIENLIKQTGFLNRWQIKSDFSSVIPKMN